MIEAQENHQAYDLLRKTELKIDRIRLDNANLTNIADRVAHLFGLESGDVLVVDYRDEALTLDIMKSCVSARSIVGKKGQLLSELEQLPGVQTFADTAILSDGMLGWIGMEEKPALKALDRAEQMASEIMKAISRRILVFSSGPEVAEKQIEDTNTPMLVNRLEKEGYQVTVGETLRDNQLYISAKIRDAAENDGYGLIITTGGVGAEDKDHTVEAITALDPGAATPYICHFKVGTGRHVKDGVRIAVGEVAGTLVVALPGPNDEVRACLEILVEGFAEKTDKAVLAERLAANLREILREKMARYHHQPDDEPDLRDTIFREVSELRISADILSDASGILSGIDDAITAAKDLDLKVTFSLEEGDPLEAEKRIMGIEGSPKQVLMAEERLIGLLAKPSGVATAARRYAEKADGRIKVIAGAWKKMPPDIKHGLRMAAVTGGVAPRIVDGPFVYLDKNYSAVFKGIGETLRQVSVLEDHVKVIHIKGTYQDITAEAWDACEHGAGIIFVDTGDPRDVIKVSEYLQSRDARDSVKIAFAGGIEFEDLDRLLSLDIDMIDVGRDIVDAPLNDMRMEVVSTRQQGENHVC